MSGIRPSPEVAPFVALIGEAATLRLVEAYPGIRVQVPARVRPEGALVRAIGRQAAARLVEEFAGTKITVPLAKHWRVQLLRRQGLSYAGIARRVGVNERTVHRILHDHGMTGQLALSF